LLVCSLPFSFLLFFQTIIRRIKEEKKMLKLMGFFILALSLLLTTINRPAPDGIDDSRMKKKSHWVMYARAREKSVLE
jgi:hypothetical protein